MRKLFLLGAVLGLFSASLALAQTVSTSSTDSGQASSPQATATSTPSTVTFPIPELGDCASKQACKAYCDAPEHKEACLAYAEAHGLMSKAKTAAARLIIKKLGPGGCTSAAVCRAYCAEEANREECYTFAVKHGIKSQEEANQNKNFQAVLKATGGPGGCLQTTECKEYCADPLHATECRAFAELHGFMRLKNVMSSTSPERFGSTSQRMMPPARLDKMSSTTNRLYKNASTSPKNLNRPIPSSNIKPPPPPPSTDATSQPSTYIPRTSLGAGVAFILEFFGW
ncbi:MAG: hypothetical protein AAB449_02125 [Patescibacteria group bacterium]